MKTAAPERHNVRIIAFARKVLLLPLTLAAAARDWAYRLYQAGKSGKVLREEDQLRQSRARRTLRGLPPDHVERPPVTVE